MTPRLTEQGVEGLSFNTADDMTISLVIRLYLLSHEINTLTTIRLLLFYDRIIKLAGVELVGNKQGFGYLEFDGGWQFQANTGDRTN